MDNYIVDITDEINFLPENMELEIDKHGDIETGGDIAIIEFDNSVVLSQN